MIRDLAQTGLRDRIITPGPSGIILPPGFTDARVTVEGVTVPAGSVLAGTTIAGTPGTMPENGALTFTPSASQQTGPAGHTTGVTVAAVTFNAAKVLNDTTIAGTAGTMPENGAIGGTITTQGGTLTAPAGHTTGGTYTANISGLVASVITIPNVAGGITGTAIPLPLTAGPLTTFTDYTVYKVMGISTWGKTSARYTVGITGSIRLQFQCENSTACTSSYQVYRNGVAVGTYRTISDNGAMHTFTEDFACNSGDYFEIYAQTTSAQCSLVAYVGIGIANPNIVTQS